MRYLPAVAIPSGALVVGLTPLHDSRMVVALADLRRRGLEVAAVEIDVSAELAAMTGQPGPVPAAALGLWRLELERRPPGAGRRRHPDRAVAGGRRAGGRARAPGAGPTAPGRRAMNRFVVVGLALVLAAAAVAAGGAASPARLTQPGVELGVLGGILLGAAMLWRPVLLTPAMVGVAAPTVLAALDGAQRHPRSRDGHDPVGGHGRGRRVGHRPPLDRARRARRHRPAGHDHGGDGAGRRRRERRGPRRREPAGARRRPARSWPGRWPRWPCSPSPPCGGGESGRCGAAGPSLNWNIRSISLGYPGYSTLARSTRRCAMPVAIVTGASKGLGRALAQALAERGWSLVVDARDAGALRRRRRRSARAAAAVAGDVTDPAHRAALVAAAEALGGVDLLVNNASTLGASPLPPARPPRARRLPAHASR